MARSEAQKRADARYKAKTYKNLQISARINDYNLIDTFCNTKGISKAQFIVSACMDFIKRDELPEGLNTIRNDSQNDTNTDM